MAAGKSQLFLASKEGKTMILSMFITQFILLGCELSCCVSDRKRHSHSIAYTSMVTFTNMHDESLKTGNGKHTPPLRVAEITTENTRDCAEPKRKGKSQMSQELLQENI